MLCLQIKTGWLHDDGHTRQPRITMTVTIDDAVRHAQALRWARAFDGPDAPNPPVAFLSLWVRRAEWIGPTTPIRDERWMRETFLGSDMYRTMLARYQAASTRFHLPSLLVP
jgi:hypothetical protein